MAANCSPEMGQHMMPTLTHDLFILDLRTTAAYIHAHCELSLYSRNHYCANRLHPYPTTTRTIALDALDQRNLKSRLYNEQSVYGYIPKLALHFPILLKHTPKHHPQHDTPPQHDIQHAHL